MTHLETFQELLARFGVDCGLPNLRPTPEGYCVFYAAQDIAVQLQLDLVSGRVAFFTEVGTVAPADYARVCPQLLTANALWLGTNGCTLGMTVDGRVILGYHEALSLLTSTTMATLVQDLVTTAEDWEENLVALQGDEPTSVAAAGA